MISLCSWLLRIKGSRLVLRNQGMLHNVHNVLRAHQCNNVISRCKCAFNCNQRNYHALVVVFYPHRGAVVSLLVD